MNIMDRLPTWIQDIAQRSAGLDGPWWVVPTGNQYRATNTPWNEPRGAPVFSLAQPSDMATVTNADIPRLLTLVHEMGEAIGDAAETLQEFVEGETILIERLWQLQEKYLGEAEDHV